MSDTPGPAGERRLWLRAAAASAHVFDLRRWRVYVAARVRQGARRVSGAFVPNLQAAVSATIAFVAAQQVFGHPVPIFAPIATYLCLGFTRNRRPRRVLELGMGASIGIWLGELIGDHLGLGWWQLLMILVIAPMIGRFLDRSEMLTFQAALQSLTVVGLSAASFVRPSAFGRWTDALVGTGVALAYSLLVPSRVSVRPRRYAKNALVELGKATETLAQGIREADDERLKDVVGQLLVVQQILDDGNAAQAAGMETAAFNPRLRHDRAELVELHRVLALTGRAVTSLYVLTRQARGILPETGPSPELADLVDRAARVLQFLAGSVGSFVPPEHARKQARELAAALTHDVTASSAVPYRASVLLSLVRALTVDTLQLSGLSRVQARAALPIDGVPTDAEDDPLPEDGPSTVWE